MKLLGLAGTLLLAATAFAAPASAQGVGVYVGPGGAGVTVGPQGGYGPRYYDDRPRGYYEDRPRVYRQAPPQQCRTYWVQRNGWSERVRECY